MFCLIIASIYLGLGRYCWTSLLLAKNWKLFFNVEGFFISIALILILIGLRPYIGPSRLQISSKGVKYIGPYWLQRKTVNWQQIVRLYISNELVIILYKPSPDRKRIWPLVIFSMYLADQEDIGPAIQKYCPVEAVAMSSPALLSYVSFSGLLHSHYLGSRNADRLEQLHYLSCFGLGLRQGVMAALRCRCL